MVIGACDRILVMKRLLKSLCMRGLSYVLGDESAKVVFYHDVGFAHTRMGTTFELLQAHVDAARKYGWTFSTGKPSLNHELSICFDDGFRGILDARSFFLREKIRPTIFIAVSLVGKPHYLTWDEILSLQDDGFIFQSHTWSHQTLVGPMIDESPAEERSDVWFDRELRQSREFLADRLGCPVTALCFPAGHFSDDVIKRAGKAGYSHLYASFPGKIPINDDATGKPLVIPRCLVQGLAVADFEAVLRGGMNPLRRRYLKQHYFRETK